MEQIGPNRQNGPKWYVDMAYQQRCNNKCYILTFRNYINYVQNLDSEEKGLVNQKLPYNYNNSYACFYLKKMYP